MKRQFLTFVAMVCGMTMGTFAMVAMVTTQQQSSPAAWHMPHPPAEAQAMEYRVEVGTAASNALTHTFTGVACTAAQGGADCTAPAPAAGWPTGTLTYTLIARRAGCTVAACETRADGVSVAIAPGAPGKPTNFRIGGTPPPPPPPPPADPITVSLATPTGPVTPSASVLALSTTGPVQRVNIDVYDTTGGLLCSVIGQAAGASGAWQARLYPTTATAGTYRVQAVAYDAVGGRVETPLLQVTVTGAPAQAVPFVS